MNAAQPVFTGNTGAETRFEQGDLRDIAFTVGLAQRRHQKLITTQPANDVVLLLSFRQTLAHFNQELVTGFVSITVVNQFEIIQIDKRDDGVTLQVPGQRKQGGQILKQGTTVG